MNKKEPCFTCLFANNQQIISRYLICRLASSANQIPQFCLFETESKSLTKRRKLIGPRTVSSGTPWFKTLHSDFDCLLNLVITYFNEKLQSAWCFFEQWRKCTEKNGGLVFEFDQTNEQLSHRISKPSLITCQIGVHVVETFFVNSTRSKIAWTSKKFFRMLKTKLSRCLAQNQQNNSKKKISRQKSVDLAEFSALMTKIVNQTAFLMNFSRLLPAQLIFLKAKKICWLEIYYNLLA